MKIYKEQLTKKYKNIFALDRNKPDWAVKKKSGDGNIHPAVPFVGESYEKTRLLLYAIAENLTHYANDDSLDNEVNAIDRRKILDDRFFPSVHISPVDNGPLLVVAAYILNKLNFDLDYSNPYEFIEYIAIDNFCKFSIKATNEDHINKDYVNDIKKISASYEYVKSDLDILKPNILILPKTIFFHNEVKKIIQSTLPNCMIFPIFQINSGNINRIIAKCYEKKNQNEIKEIFLKWQKEFRGGIRGKTNKNFYSVYSYLDKFFEN